jgi:hypothetical protein
MRALCFYRQDLRIIVAIIARRFMNTNRYRRNFLAFALSYGQLPPSMCHNECNFDATSGARSAISSAPPRIFRALDSFPNGTRPSRRSASAPARLATAVSTPVGGLPVSAMAFSSEPTASAISCGVAALFVYETVWILAVPCATDATGP